MILKKAQLFIFIVSIIFGLSAVVHSATDVPEVATVEGDLALNNTIKVEVKLLSEYQNKPNFDPAKFMLYLNWRPLKGVNALLNRDGGDKLQFDVKRTADSKEQWNALLGSPFAKGLTPKVNVSVGYDNQEPIKSAVTKNLIIVRFAWFWVFLGFFVLAVVLFLNLAWNTAIIRDSSSLSDLKERPYSLGCTQMGLWFFTIVASYFFIWMVTGDYETISGTALVLMGISAGTGLGARAIGNTKSSAAKRKFKSLLEERQALQDRLATMEDDIKAAIEPERSLLKNEKFAKKARLDQVDRDIQELDKPAQNTQGFLWDMVMEDDGVSFHRFQICIWTIILWFVFLVSMYKPWQCPSSAKPS